MNEMNREDIIRMAREIWSAGDVYVGPSEKNLERFAALVAAAERNKLAAWMIQFGFATGHGDTMEQLVDALGSEIVDRIEFEIDVAVNAEREACAKVCESMRPTQQEFDQRFYTACTLNANAIRARGQS